jgi:HK97 family phage major capsid protein/HK97 family phage prohead protease
MKMELRVQNAELRSDKKGSLTVSGYVNKTEQLSEILGTTKRFVEKISRGAFSRAIKNASRDIDFLAEHDGKKILASTRNNSLVLSEDSQGLFMEATITPTSYGKDAYELINSGIFRNMSFGFRTIRDNWKATASGIFERTIEELELFEVSVVKDPAYSQSTIAARSIELIEEPEIHVEEKEEERELPNEIKVFQLEVAIEKQKNEVRAAKETLKILPESSAFKTVLERENNKLSALSEELRQLQEKQEEQPMKNEDRALQYSTTPGVQSVVQSVQIDDVVKKVVSTSSVFSKARKIPFLGSDLKIPYETAFDEATFIAEGADAPETAFTISNMAVMERRRVARSIAMSKQFMHDSGADLSGYSKELVTRQVLKKIEKSIIAGNTAIEFKGIAPDALVPSKNVSLAANVVAELRKLYLAVHEDFVGNSSFYMSRLFFEKVAAATDANGNHVVKSVVVNGKIVPTLFGHEIEVTSALADGTTIGQVPVLFGSIEDCYTVGVAQDLTVKDVSNDTVNALRGSVAYVAEFYGDGRVHNYSAIAKGTIVA